MEAYGPDCPPEPHELHDDHAARIWAGATLWGTAAACLLLVTLVHASPRIEVLQLRWLAAVCLFCATVPPVVLIRLSARKLYTASSILAALGTLVMWQSIVFSGGAASDLSVFYIIPSFYVAYFFRPKHVVMQLTFASLLLLSPLVYDHHLAGTQFPGRAAVLLAAMWGTAFVIGKRKRELVTAELQAHRQARRDPLTGLHNLRSMRERVERAPLGLGSAVLAIDLDNFKSINSAYGHTGADELLRAAARGLLAAVRDGDSVIRVGGDEFMVLAERPGRAQLDDLARACERAVAGARTSAELEGPDATCSIGIALWGDDGRDLSTLAEMADRRMFAAKAACKAGRPSGGSVPSQRSSSTYADAVSSFSSRGANARSAAVPRQATGGWRGWLARTTEECRASSLTWLGAGALILLVILAPDADRSRETLVFAVIAVCAGMAAGLLTFAPRHGVVAHTVGVLAATATLLLAIYGTGGATSPLVPCVLFSVTYCAYHLEPRRAALQMAGPLAVAATPILYASAADRLAFVVSYGALVNSALVLAGILMVSRRTMAAAEAASRELAVHDPLTGLPNRRAFQECMERLLHDAPDAPVAVAIVDLDNFKQVNDGHGHAAGDDALRAIAARLLTTARAEDCVARIGGDEFAVIAHGIPPETIDALGRRLVRAVEEAAAAAGFADCEVSATVGYALHPHHGRSVDGIIQAADAALMEGKEAGKRRVACAPLPALSLAV